MSTDEVRQCIVAMPFKPFTINMQDGRRIPVMGRDYILLPPGARTGLVVLPACYSWIETSMIKDISYEIPIDTAPEHK